MKNTAIFQLVDSDHLRKTGRIKLKEYVIDLDKSFAMLKSVIKNLPKNKSSV